LTIYSHRGGEYEQSIAIGQSPLSFSKLSMASINYPVFSKKGQYPVSKNMKLAKLLIFRYTPEAVIFN